MDYCGPFTIHCEIWNSFLNCVTCFKFTLEFLRHSRCFLCVFPSTVVLLLSCLIAKWVHTSFPLTGSPFLCLLPSAIRRALWTACMRRCRAPAMDHLHPSPAAHPAVPAAALAAPPFCWKTTLSGEARDAASP